MRSHQPPSQISRTPSPETSPKSHASLTRHLIGVAANPCSYQPAHQISKAQFQRDKASENATSRRTEGQNYAHTSQLIKSSKPRRSSEMPPETKQPEHRKGIFENHLHQHHRAARHQSFFPHTVIRSWTHRNPGFAQQHATT